MPSPIIAFTTDFYDVVFFHTLEAAEAYMEPEDVDEWEAYTAEGRVIVVSVMPGTYDGFPGGRGHIKLKVSDELAVERLQDVLTNYFSVLGRSYQADAALTDLVQELLGIVGFS